LTQGFYCKACDPLTNGLANCGCPIGQYCSKNVNDATGYGTCKTPANIPIGKPCDPRISPFNLVKDGDGSNANMFCGLIVWDGSTLVTVEWMGACILGICQFCAPGPYLCPDSRICTFSSNLVDAPAGGDSWAFLAQNPWIGIGCLQALFMSIMICTGFYCFHQKAGTGGGGNSSKPKDTEKKTEPRPASAPANNRQTAGKSVENVAMEQTPDTMSVKEGWVVEATHDYTAEPNTLPLQLSFRKGQLIHVTGLPTPTRWIFGYLDGTSAEQAGWFSADFVSVKSTGKNAFGKK